MKPSDVRSAPRAAPIVFGPPTAQVFGFYHAPSPARARGVAVVLCNPLGYEAVCAHHAYRVLAERLAEAGLAALRFDYPGTGDASGDERDPGRIAAALGAIHAALDEALARSGAREAAVFGVRMGATLAAIAAADRGGVESAALWAPCVTGAAYVRQIRVVARAGGVATAAPSADQESAGFLLTRATVAELGRIDLAKLAAPPARRALIVARAGISTADEQLVARLEALGTTAQAVAIDGYSSMMLDPHEALFPRAVIDAVVGWLAEGPPHEAFPPPEDACARAPSLWAGPPGGDPAGVVETPGWFGPGGRLFGIVAEPREPSARRDLGVVLVSVGAIHRIGPGRLYVTLARRLAALGVPSLRFDLSGIGDSPPARDEEENVLYAPGTSDDVRAAMDRLAHEAGCRRFVLFGLCAGAHAAYEAARADARTAALWLVNLPVFEHNEGDPVGSASSKAFKSNAFYGRALLSADTWARILNGEVDARRIARVISKRLARRVRALGERVRSRDGGASAESRVARALAALCARGTDVTILYGESEPGLDEAQLHVGTSRSLEHDARFRLLTMEGADHTFASGEARTRLIDLLVTYVRAHAPPPRAVATT